MMSLLGLFAPVLLLLGICLSEEDEGGQFGSLRPALSSIAYGIVCLVSVPVTVFLLSFFAPAFSAGLAVMAEIAIVLLTSIVLGMALLWGRDRRLRRVDESRRETD